MSPRFTAPAGETEMTLTKTNTPREIERKFLLRRRPENLADYPHEEIEQGYLAVERGGVQVRLRKKGNVRTLAFKRGTKSAREEREIRLSVRAIRRALAGHGRTPPEQSALRCSVRRAGRGSGHLHRPARRRGRGGSGISRRRKLSHICSAGLARRRCRRANHATATS